MGSSEILTPPAGQRLSSASELCFPLELMMSSIDRTLAVLWKLECPQSNDRG
jgi:hypothetical protein